MSFHLLPQYHLILRHITIIFDVNVTSEWCLFIFYCREIMLKCIISFFLNLKREKGRFEYQKGRRNNILRFVYNVAIEKSKLQPSDWSIFDHFFRPIWNSNILNTLNPIILILRFCRNYTPKDFSPFRLNRRYSQTHQSYDKGFKIQSVSRRQASTRLMLNVNSYSAEFRYNENGEHPST